jgi:hypothetical protein
MPAHFDEHHHNVHLTNGQEMVSSAVSAPAKNKFKPLAKQPDAWKNMAKYGNGKLGKGFARSYNTVSEMGAKNNIWWIYNVLMSTRNSKVIAEH